MSLFGLLSHEPQVDASHLFILGPGLREGWTYPRSFSQEVPNIRPRAGKNTELWGTALFRGARNSPRDLSVWRYFPIWIGKLEIPRLSRGSVVITLKNQIQGNTTTNRGSVASRSALVAWRFLPRKRPTTWLPAPGPGGLFCPGHLASAYDSL